MVGSGFRRAASSVVEHLTFNQGVPGSIPGRPTKLSFFSSPVANRPKNRLVFAVPISPRAYTTPSGKIAA
jgi:hypothetical protein